MPPPRFGEGHGLHANRVAGCRGTRDVHFTRDELLQAYERMRLIRAICDQPAYLARARHGSVPSPVGPRRSLNDLGSEAGLVGVTWSLTTQDGLCAGRDDPALRLAHGAPASDVLADLLGHPVAPPLRADLRALVTRGAAPETHGPMLANGPAQMVGAALARRQTHPEAVTVYFADPQADQTAPLWEAVEAARDLSLRVLFVAVRQGPGEWVPGEKRKDACSPFALRARSCGIESLTARADDLFSVQPAALEAVTQLRKQASPLLLELVHVGDDPLRLFRSRTIHAGLMDAARLDGTDRAVEDAFAAMMAPQTVPKGPRATFANPETLAL